MRVPFMLMYSKLGTARSINAPPCLLLNHPEASPFATKAASNRLQKAPGENFRALLLYGLRRSSVV